MAGGEWQTASETSLEERENSMTVKSAPAKGRRGGGARAGLGQGIGGASGGQVVKEGTPQLKKVRPDIHAGGEKEDQGRHCWSAVENHSQDWKTCTTNQRIPSEGHASLQGWWIPALASSSSPCA